MVVFDIFVSVWLGWGYSKRVFYEYDVMVFWILGISIWIENLVKIRRWDIRLRGSWWFWFNIDKVFVVILE